jgi:PAS domain S-box-containing protein
MLQMYGYENDEFLNLSINDISLGIVPYTQNEAMKLINSVKLKGPKSVEWMAKHKSGEIFWVEVSMSKIIIGGKEQLLAMVRDISERKIAEEKLTSSEARYRYLFEHNPAPMLIYERTSLQILAVNEAFQLHYGYPSDEITKMILPDLHPENEKVAISELVTKLFGYKIVGEWHHVKRDGSIITIIARSHDIGFENHSARVAVITDISDLKKAEKVLIEAKENAEKSERLKSHFLAQMSHEIRSPINNILNFSELIRDTLDPQIVEEHMESFSAVEQAGSRIVRTIDLILNMSELQTGSYECKFEKLNLIDLLESIYNEYKFKAEKKKLALLYSPGEKDVSIFADEYSVVQIFINLLDNAIKYTNVGLVEISILLRNDNKVEVKFTDTGIGISENYLENIFTPFSQEEQGYTRRFEGNGLGLALVKRYCEMNNAEIMVDSVKGKG